MWQFLKCTQISRAVNNSKAFSESVLCFPQTTIFPVIKVCALILNLFFKMIYFVLEITMRKQNNLTTSITLLDKLFSIQTCFSSERKWCYGTKQLYTMFDMVIFCEFHIIEILSSIGHFCLVIMFLHCVMAVFLGVCSLS